MFQKILVAVDMSEYGENVLQKSLAIAKAADAGLMLLHVLSPDEEGTPAMSGGVGLSYYEMIDPQYIEAYQNQWREFAQHGSEQLQAYATRARNEGVRAECNQIPGKPGRAICEQAKNWGAELIVMGRRGHSGLGELILGSVSNYVVHHAPCSVMIVQLGET